MLYPITGIITNKITKTAITIAAGINDLKLSISNSALISTKTIEIIEMNIAIANAPDQELQLVDTSSSNVFQDNAAADGERLRIIVVVF